MLCFIDIYIDVVKSYFSSGKNFFGVSSFDCLLKVTLT
jgi:hypothetical protein